MVWLLESGRGQTDRDRQIERSLRKSIWMYLWKQARNVKNCVLGKVIQKTGLPVDLEAGPKHSEIPHPQPYFRNVDSTYLSHSQRLLQRHSLQLQ